ncbi:MAG: AmmeMemoRadiSam system radical SAM enzyme [Defluviitaleaceae bacterium]|nr:AmmeMemoRadiSam system radical SAM enzyme [Defluviitaleaceae bacterium]
MIYGNNTHGGSKPDVPCEICPHACLIPEGKYGKCTVRKNKNGRIFAESYGKITAIALDPIEKKPLYMFCPGTKILSIGSYGCNFRCPFCQNHEIAMPAVKPHFAEGASKTSKTSKNMHPANITPDEILKLAQDAVVAGNIGVAYTYNEPLINYEFLFDCAKIIRAAGLKNVVITNGFINPEPLKKLLPLIDAMNIDLKAFTPGFYEKIGGNLETVKNTISLAFKSTHIEITTLVIPGENDNDIEPIAEWLASLSPEIPLHLSRFFPRNQYTGRSPTPHELIIHAAQTARKHLNNVFMGNMK